MHSAIRLAVCVVVAATAMTVFADGGAASPRGDEQPAEPTDAKATSSGGNSWGGAAAGVASGALAGALLGPIGVAAGSVIGGVAGWFAGAERPHQGEDVGFAGGEPGRAESREAVDRRAAEIAAIQEHDQQPFLTQIWTSP